MKEEFDETREVVTPDGTEMETVHAEVETSSANATGILIGALAFGLLVALGVGVALNNEVQTQSVAVSHMDHALYGDSANIAKLQAEIDRLQATLAKEQHNPNF